MGRGYARHARADVELFLPAHGLPIAGASRIRKVLTDVAETLETPERRSGAHERGLTLDHILHDVRVGPGVLEKPWMKPLYDGRIRHPEHLASLRRLVGWQPGAAEAGAGRGGGRRAGSPSWRCGSPGRGRPGHADAGDFRLACHLVEYALAEPENLQVHGLRAEIYQARRNQRPPMAKGIFGTAANVSEKIDPMP